MQPNATEWERMELRRISARLTAEFSPPLDAADVQSCVDQLAAQWADARIRQFVPLLVERAARSALVAPPKGAASAAAAHDRQDVRATGPVAARRGGRAARAV